MPRRHVYHVQNIIPDPEDAVDGEVFGSTVKVEVKKATKILNDFADFYDEIKRDYDEIISMLNACTQRGQVAQVMRNVRRRYM